MKFVPDSLCVAILTLVMTLCVVKSPAQSSSATEDSTAKKPNRVRWILSLDSRSTIIEKKNITINGALGGISFGEKSHKITLGYYWLNYDGRQRLVSLRKSMARRFNLSYYTKTDVSFLSLAYWYPLHKSKKWMVYLPGELGIGQESAHYRHISDDGYIGKKDFYFAPFQVGVYGEYRVTKWAGLDAQVGYRDTLYKGPFRKHFNGVYYSYGFTLYPGTIYADLKHYFSRNKDKAVSQVNF
jgi:hypothetical protein